MAEERRFRRVVRQLNDGPGNDEFNMNDTKVSIIMPAYNQENYIGEAVDSVLKQTYENWELIVVDDGSVDATSSIVSKYPDSRIRYLRQTKQGVCVARNLGIRETVGEYVAFLDADDLFHPDKLKVQVEYLNHHPEAGLVFVSRIEIDRFGKPMGFFSHEGEVSLGSLVLGFPFAPSDLMLRREWIRRAGGFNNSYVVNEDRDWYIRLFYEGCRCEGIRRFLSYRRLDHLKVFRDLQQKMDDMVKALNAAFGDSRCSADVLDLKNQAYLNIHMAWFYQAAVQGEDRLAGEYLDRIVQLTPAVQDDDAEKFWAFMLHTSTRDGGDHEQRLNSVHDRVSAELRLSGEELARLISRGYMLRGVREAMWGRCDQADDYFSQVGSDNLVKDPALGSIISDLLMNYELAFGSDSTQEASGWLFEKLRENFNPREVDSIVGIYLLNQAFAAYRNKRYVRAIKRILLALRRKPSLLLNRGVYAIFFKSAYRQAAGFLAGVDHLLEGILAGGL